MDARTAAALRARLGLPAKAPSTAATLVRASLPHFVIRPFLKRFRLREMRVSEESACDYVCCILARQTRSPSAAPPSAASPSAAQAAGCVYCGHELLEDVHEGMVVCTQCGAVASELVQLQGYVPWESHAPIRGAQFRYASRGSDCERRAMSDSTLQQRVEEVCTDVAFDVEYACSILRDFSSNGELTELKTACVVAAVVVSVYERAIRNAVALAAEDSPPRGRVFKCPKCSFCMNSYKEFRNHRCERSIHAYVHNIIE